MKWSLPYIPDVQSHSSYEAVRGKGELLFKRLRLRQGGREEDGGGGRLGGGSCCRYLVERMDCNISRGHNVDAAARRP